MRVGVVLVVGEFLMEEFVNNGGDVGGLSIICLNPHLVPPLNIEFYLCHSYCNSLNLSLQIEALQWIVQQWIGHNVFKFLLLYHLLFISIGELYIEQKNSSCFT